MDLQLTLNSSEQPSSPATITSATANTTTAPSSTVDDIFGTAATGSAPATKQPAPSNPPTQSAFDDTEDEFEGLEDAKEGSADDEFANISRSDYNPVFDSSPPPSQTKSESTAFGNESSFDFVSANSANSANGAPALASENQQKGAESHDWDAIFSGLDSPSATTMTPLPPPAAAAAPAPATDTPAETDARPTPPGRIMTEDGKHDDPILKNLTTMGYTRTNALQALEKYDYNLERVRSPISS